MSRLIQALCGAARATGFSRQRCSAAGGDDSPVSVVEGLPEELERVRQIKRLGLAVSGVVLTAGTAAAFTAGMRPPQEVLWTVESVAAAVPLGLGALKITLGDDLHIEWHDGRVWLDYAVKDLTKTLSDGAIAVRPTTDGRGNGAFAAVPIARGTFIGEYEGDMLSEAQYWSRYPSGVSDYCIRVDAQWTIDGAGRAPDTSAFSACHMNHAGGAVANVARQTLRHDRRVMFYAQRDISAGEELLLDYGSVYWTGREDKIVS